MVSYETVVDRIIITIIIKKRNEIYSLRFNALTQANLIVPLLQWNFRRTEILEPLTNQILLLHKYTSTFSNSNRSFYALAYSNERRTCSLLKIISRLTAFISLNSKFRSRTENFALTIRRAEAIGLSCTRACIVCKTEIQNGNRQRQ